MADVIAELKALRLHGMAATWAELGEQRNAEVERSRWLLEHMLQAEASVCVRPTHLERPVAGGQDGAHQTS